MVSPHTRIGGSIDKWFVRCDFAIEWCMASIKFIEDVVIVYMRTVTASKFKYAVEDAIQRQTCNPICESLFTIVTLNLKVMIISNVQWGKLLPCFVRFYSMIDRPRVDHRYPTRKKEQARLKRWHSGNALCLLCDQRVNRRTDRWLPVTSEWDIEFFPQIICGIFSR